MRRALTKLRQRVAGDLQMTVITLIAALAVASILPFGVFRLIQGHTALAVIDFAIVVSIVIAMVHSLRSGNSRYAGTLMAAITTASCAVVTFAFDNHGLYWTYVVFTTNFMIAPRRVALLANLVVLVGVAFSPSAIETVFELAVYLSTGILVSTSAYLFAQHTANQRAQLVSVASRDSLTGARNRLLMTTDLALARQEHQGKESSGAIAMLDLDRFKRVNDAFGHEAGDRALVEFVRLIEAHSRKSDRLYRFGGEEFVLLLPNTPEPGVRIQLEKLRRVIESELKDPDGNAITVSAGAAMQNNDADWSQWLSRADFALYRAKAGGRNRVVMDGDPELEGGLPAVDRRQSSR